MVACIAGSSEIHASRFGCLLGVFAHDQHERRDVLFQARHCRHCHVSEADPRTREKA